MPLARVVTFDGVSSDRMAEMRREMEGSDRPDDIPAKEIVVLHDPDAEKSLVIVFFETEDDYQRGDAALNAMPTDDVHLLGCERRLHPERAARPTLAREAVAH